MIVKSFEYDNYLWKLDTIYLDKLNLIVGKNAVGKSKTLMAMVEVARFIKGETAGVNAHSCRIVFSDATGKELIYSYNCNAKEIKSESMIYGDKELILRDDTHSLVNGKNVNPPQNKLVIQSQRDTTKFPEFEIVMSWAEHTRGFSFSELSSSQSYMIPNMFSEKIDFSELFEKIDDEKEQFIINNMRELGYKINEISKFEVQQFKMITLSEDGVFVPLFSSYMSNGMLRVFYILTYMAYVATVEGAKTFLVDDLGEGLDYSRSSRLSKIMFDYCETHDIQLIVTSNDNFLMNAINLDNWIILQRKGKNVSAYSRITHPDMFVKFRKMGLNNFDMLSTDFIERFLSSAEQ